MVKGPCNVTVPIRLSIPALKRGVVGTVTGGSLRIQRPRFGFRRASRAIAVTGVTVGLVTHYKGSRRFTINRVSDGTTVYQRRGKRIFVAEDASPCETATALALDFAGVVSSSSLLNFISI